MNDPKITFSKSFEVFLKDPSEPWSAKKIAEKENCSIQLVYKIEQKALWKLIKLYR